MRETKKNEVEVVYDFLHRGDEEVGRPGTVWLRWREGGKRRYASTGVKVLPSEWRDGRDVEAGEVAELDVGQRAEVGEVDVEVVGHGGVSLRMYEGRAPCYGALGNDDDAVVLPGCVLGLLGVVGR